MYVCIHREICIHNVVYTWTERERERERERHRERERERYAFAAKPHEIAYMLVQSLRALLCSFTLCCMFYLFTDVLGHGVAYVLQHLLFLLYAVSCSVQIVLPSNLCAHHINTPNSFRMCIRSLTFCVRATWKQENLISSRPPTGYGHLAILAECSIFLPCLSCSGYIMSRPRHLHL